MVFLNSLSSVIFQQNRALVFQLPNSPSPTAWRSLTFLSRVLAINDLAWMSLAVLSIYPRTTNINQEVFSFIKINRVKPVQGSDESLDPSIFQ